VAEASAAQLAEKTAALAAALGESEAQLRAARDGLQTAQEEAAHSITALEQVRHSCVLRFMAIIVCLLFVPCFLPT
jgi:hypothetical protein